MSTTKLSSLKTTGAFVGASWGALLVGVAGYGIGLYNAHFSMVEKGLYITILLYGLFAVVSVQKTVRDRAEGIRTTNIYYGLAWVSVIASLGILTVFLWNAEMLLVEKGYYGITMVLAMFGVIAVQKNVRDLAVFAELEPDPEPEEYQERIQDQRYDQHQ